MLHRAPVAPVRAEYAALVEGYPELLKPFGVTLSVIDLADLGVLVAAIDEVDQRLDNEPDAAVRTRTASSVLAILGGEHDQSGASSSQTGEPRSVVALRSLAIERGITCELRALTAEIIANSERIRAARDRGAYLAAVEREGVLCNELALLVVPLPDAPAGFLRAIAPAANLLDKLIDLRGDHRRGEVALAPDLGAHAVLARSLLAAAWRASRLHPQRTEFLRWALRWVRRMAS